MRGLWIYTALFSLIFSIFLLEEGAIFSVILLFVWFMRLVILKEKKVLLLSLALGFLFTVNMSIRYYPKESTLSAETNEWTVEVKRTSFKIDGDQIQFYGRVISENKEEVVVRYQIKTEEEKEKWISGEVPKQAKILGILEQPKGSRNFYLFDYKEYLNRQDIHWMIKAEELDSSVAKAESLSFDYKIDSLRQDLLDQIDQRIHGESADYVRAMIFADRRSLSEETVEQYRSIGIIHLISISGLHIQFLINGARRFLLRMKITRETTDWILLFCLPIYGTFAGWGVSVFRAIIQAMLALIFSKCFKRSNSLDCFSITLLLALFLNPYSIYTIGFQLSYLLSGLLIILTKQSWYRKKNKWIGNMLLSLLITLASIPILSFHFFEFPWIALAANALFVPIFSWIFLPSLIGVFTLSCFLWQSSFFLGLNQLINQLIFKIDSLIALSHYPFQFSFVTGRLSVIGMVLLFIGLWCFIHTIEVTEKRKVYLAIGLITFTVGLFSERFSPIGKVLLLDVGQGESILIKEPYGKGATLIDTGGQIKWRETEAWRERESLFSLGKDTVAPAVKAHGVSTIDQLYITHADMDHMGALVDIIEELYIKKISMTKGTLLDENMSPVLPLLYEKNINVETIAALETRTFPNNFLLLYPFNEGEGGNKDSLVLYGEIGEYTWLFTGDLEEEGEMELIQKYPNLTADVLNVGHHGSNTSSYPPLLNQLEANIAWISSGENNSYGHPHPDVLKRLTEYEMEIYRTDKQGAILYEYSQWPIIRNYSNRMIPHKKAGE